MGNPDGQPFRLSAEITCVDCLGRAFLMPRSYPDEPLAVGDVLSYRCQDCGDRWDLVVEEDDLDPD
ncbi:hypothetical protein FEAC_26010 [Ferrimicrobium acidiphilum DSM 19497]|uniref:Uncharacterized protein n=1 Tax=Ferrimicrobium acidiphilum DSM 19497 TaxID=1121877 RepID=A0A0D8FR62_9ACTN|nr:hypothetical protein FEAC_26010 [Ferrimicrobium acidiphilum DSM 19497]